MYTIHLNEYDNNIRNENDNWMNNDPDNNVTKQAYMIGQLH